MVGFKLIKNEFSNSSQVYDYKNCNVKRQSTKNVNQEETENSIEKMIIFP